jgi:hypothetical protein
MDMLTKQAIVELLKTRDAAVARALVVLNQRQTPSEQATESTRHRNGQGFRPAHARMGTSMANFYTKNGYLSARQINWWRQPMRDGKMRIEIYAGQLLEVAQQRAADSHAAVARNVYIGQDIGNLSEQRLVLVERYEWYDDGSGSAVNLEQMRYLKQTIDQIDQAIAIAQQRQNQGVYA